MTDETTAGNGQTADAAADSRLRLGVTWGTAAQSWGFSRCAVCGRSVGNELYATILKDGVCGVACRACVAAGPSAAADALRKEAAALTAQADEFAALTPAEWVTVADLDKAAARLRAQRAMQEAADRLKTLADALVRDDTEALFGLLDDGSGNPFAVNEDDIPF